VQLNIFNQNPKYLTVGVNGCCDGGGGGGNLLTLIEQY